MSEITIHLSEFEKVVESVAQQLSSRDYFTIKDCIDTIADILEENQIK